MMQNQVERDPEVALMFEYHLTIALADTPLSAARCWI